MNFEFKQATNPRWHLHIGSLVIQWWSNEPWHRKLEVVWRA